MSEKQEYKGIFKSTFLFGFVQVFNILVKVALNKTVAILLGANGMGIIGLLQPVINILKTALGLGLSESAVRDISEMNELKDQKRFSLIIGVTKKLIWATAFMSVVVTIILSQYLSEWTFGNGDYTISFIWLSLAVAFNILTDGHLAILKGLRQLKVLAKASLFGAFLGVFVSIPFYFFFGMDGIVPSLISSSLATFFFAWYFSRKTSYVKSKVSAIKCMAEGKGMVKMGIALMYVSFLGFVSDYIVRSYISRSSSVEMVGFFQAGATIITSYFGIVITAMTTDYYPRISAINKDNNKLEIEVNRQSKVGLILFAPLVVLFMFLMPFFVQILYSKEFLISIDYLQFAVFGSIIIVCSNAMGMILLAKQKSDVFVYSVTFSRVLMVIVNVLAYKYYGLKGVGIAYFIMSIEHILLMQIIMKLFYNIKFRNDTLKLLAVVLLFTLSAFYIKSMELNIKYILGVVLFIISVYYSHYKMRTIMEIDMLKFIKDKLTKR